MISQKLTVHVNLIQICWKLGMCLEILLHWVSEAGWNTEEAIPKK